MASATCPKCKTKFTPVDGQPIACPGCGQKFKTPAHNPGGVAVASPPVNEPAPPSFTREDLQDDLLPPDIPLIDPTRQRFTVPLSAFNPDGQHRPLPTAGPRHVAAIAPERTSTVARVVWFLFVFWIGICILGNFAGFGAANGAIQEAVVGIETCVGLIAGYALCRAIDSITKY